MTRLRIAALLASLLVANTVLASDPVTEPAGTTAQKCPPKKMVPADYPPAAARAGASGLVTMRHKLDSCGRVTEAEVVDGAHRLLDAAALDALRQWVLEPPSPERKPQPVDGWYEQKIAFGLDAQPTPRQMGWPRTHKRPRYELEAPSPEFPDVDTVATIVDKNKDSFAPPYTGMFGRFIATGTQAQPEFWLMARIDGQQNLAVRYRPAMEGDEPVVRLLVVCARPPETCVRDQEFLMRGLPFAKAKK